MTRRIRPVPVAGLALAVASLVVAGAALAATGDLTFAGCFEDEDFNLEGASCPNAPGLWGADAVAVSGDGTSVYVTSLFDDAIAHFSRDPSTGTLSFQNCIEDEDSDLEGTSCANAPGLDGAAGVAVSGDGTAVYVASEAADAVAHFSRDPSGGDLGFQGCVEDEDSDFEGAKCENAPGLGGARRIALSGDGTAAYVASANDNAVAHFDRNPSTGALAFLDCVEDEDSNLEGAGCANAPGLDGATGLAVSGEGTSVYVTSVFDSAVAHFNRLLPSGTLSFQGCIEDEDSNLEGASCSNAPGLGGAFGVAVSGDGTSVYATSLSDAIGHFSRNLSTGALGFQACIEDEDSNSEGASCADAPGLDAAEGVAVSGDGTSVYVASEADGAVDHFGRDSSNGALGFQGCVEDEDSNLEGPSCSDAPGLGQARGVALSGDGTSVYVASNADNAVDHFGRETPPPPPEDGGVDVTPPDTTITKRPKDKTKKKRATFEFTSTEPGSAFECKLDGGSFQPCTSPHDVKVGKGKHSFEVRARDAAGNADPAPATDGWKVKKKKRKR